VRAVPNSTATLRSTSPYKDGMANYLGFGGVHRYETLNVDYNIYISKAKTNYAAQKQFSLVNRNVGFTIERSSDEYFPTVRQTEGADWTQLSSYTENIYSRSGSAGWDGFEGASLNVKKDFTTPVGSIYGPKAMIINEFAGSGGDLMPWLFRKANVGPLIGKRTWGGLVGIYDYPQLIDGGGVTAPRVAFYNRQGEWEVENYGTAPDIEVELDPQAWRAGRDPQLEKAVEVVMDALKKNPLPKPRKPAYPNYHNGRSSTSKAQGAKDTRKPGN
jgi:hypothetical protein